MACLSRGRAVVTTTGHLTEPLWAETRAVEIADVADSATFVSLVVSLLTHAQARAELGARGQRIYEQRFSVSQIVNVLRAA